VDEVCGRDRRARRDGDRAKLQASRTAPRCKDWSIVPFREWGRIDVLGVQRRGSTRTSGPLAEHHRRRVRQDHGQQRALEPVALPDGDPGDGRRNDGSVVVISSNRRVQGNLSLGAYGISKAADFQLVRNLAVEWGPRNGARQPRRRRRSFAHDFARKHVGRTRKIYAKAIHGYPLRRIGEPDEVAGAAIFWRRRRVRS